VYKEKDSYEKNLYKNVVFDFQFLEKPEEYEDEIQSNVNMIELDEKFKEAYSEIID
jgi:hypothetical protein